MIGELFDFLSENRDLDLWRTSVFVASSDFLDDLFLVFLLDCHLWLLLARPEVLSAPERVLINV